MRIHISVCTDVPNIYEEIEVAFFISIHPDVQEQRKDDEREGRRKGIFPDNIFLGHAVKSCMTVIGFDGGLSKVRKICRFPMETAFSIL